MSNGPESNIWCVNRLFISLVQYCFLDIRSLCRSMQKNYLLEHLNVHLGKMFGPFQVERLFLLAKKCLCPSLSVKPLTFCACEFSALLLIALNGKYRYELESIET